MIDRMALLHMLQERAKQQFPALHPPCDCRLQALITELQAYIAACRKRGKAQYLMTSANIVYPAVADEMQTIVSKYTRKQT